MRLKYFSSCIITILSALLLAGCGDGTKVRKKKTDWSNHYDELNKNPFSFYLTYNSLPLLFPKAKTEEVSNRRRLNNLGYTLRQNKGKSLIILLGQQVNFNEGEVDSLFSFVEEGHQVMVSCAYFDDALMKRLGVKKSFEDYPAQNGQQLIFLRGKNEEFESYQSKTKRSTMLGFFEKQEIPDIPFFVLGMNNQKQPDCIVYSVGSGKLILHAAPMAFTNYFLLQQNNKEYLNNIFSFISEPVSNIYVIPFYNRTVSTSDFSEIWNNIATRIAFLLTLFTLGIFLAFEMKRRQKIIPIIKPIENSSVAFTETIGRLYFNKKNHTNLAEKMVQHFLEFVRSNYYLNTSNLDKDFVRMLAAKSGQEISKTDSLIYNIKEVQSGTDADEAFLYSLYTQIQDFYNGK
jgi:hypothetical protein